MVKYFKPHNKSKLQLSHEIGITINYWNFTEHKWHKK